MNELSPNTVFNTIDKCIIYNYNFHSKYPLHMPFLHAENCSSKFTIMSFWVPVPKSPVEICILKKSLDMSLRLRNSTFQCTSLFRLVVIHLQEFHMSKMTCVKHNWASLCNIVQSNLYKITTLGTNQKWSSWAGGCLIKHLYKTATKQIVLGRFFSVFFLTQ